MNGPRPRRALPVRLAIYLVSMFPPWVMVPAGLAMFGAVHGAMQALAGPGPLRFGWIDWAGAASAVLAMLLMRVYDELKDVEGDIALGRAGDPRYKDRPIVTGAVLAGDIELLRWVVSALLIALNAALGWPLPGVAFLLLFAAGWLSFKWFYCPAIQKNLLLAFATHNPLTAVLLLYVVAVWAAGHGLEHARPGPTALLVVGQWFPLAAWETSRKIRIPQDETTYQTYSMLLGWKVAPLLPPLFAGIATACLIAVARAAGLSWGYPAVLATAWGALAFACLRFRFAPTTNRAKLQPFAELFTVVASVGMLVALVHARGVAAWL